MIDYAWISKILRVVAFTLFQLPPFSLIRDFEKQNTRGNVSQIAVSPACYRQIGSISTNHSPLTWRKEGLKVTLVWPCVSVTRVFLVICVRNSRFSPCVSVTRVFIVIFRQQPEATFEQCSFDFRIPRRHDVDGNFLLRSPHVLTLRVCSTTLVSVLC